jgi:hypothetical protein
MKDLSLLFTTMVEAGMTLDTRAKMEFHRPRSHTLGMSAKARRKAPNTKTKNMTTHHGDIEGRVVV